MPRSCHALKRESRGVRLPVPLCSDSSAVGHVLDSLQIIVKQKTVTPPPEDILPPAIDFRFTSGNSRGLSATGL
ncbi:hypothetical protein NQZ68_029022 [Dissostichus eleginoides]|nr:hypothetical protein NQZ68_029022 [Dissostichus eleginoides]